MSYVATVRYAEGKEGSQILGIYSTRKEAQDILDLYRRNASFEILEIQHVTRNMIPEDLNNLEIQTATEDEEFFSKGDTYLRAEDASYENQGEYIDDKKLLSKTVYSEFIDN